MPSSIALHRHGRAAGRRPHVVVALHAHPDDESLLTGGTIAALVRAGHRVVLVVATDGEAGLADGAVVDLGRARREELDRAGRILGVSRVVRLGYRDSGLAGDVAGGFCHTDADEVAARVATVLREERADLLLGYDERGGYGHPDHVHVHAVARRAARTTGTRLLHATVDRTWLERGLRLADRFGVRPGGVAPGAAAHWYCDRREITHRVPVRRVSGAKRRALACHATQAAGDDVSVRTVRLLSRLPRPLFAVVAGVEWFVEDGAPPSAAPLRDPLTPVGAGAA